MITRAQCITWIADLRSGKFEQGKSRLKTIGLTTTQHCCLGVLGEQVMPDVIAKRFAQGSLNYSARAESKAEPLPSDLKLTSPEIGQEAEAEAILIYLNDTLGYDFNQIADFIEQHLLPQLPE